MLFINYKNDTPQQRFYSLGVKGNHNANKIRFVVARKQADIDLTNYVCNLKVENKEVEYKDLIMLDLVKESESELVFEWVMTNKSTQFRTLELQLEFLSTENENDVVWQTLIVGLELNDTIKVGDERPTDKELSVLKQVEAEVKSYDNRITKNSEDIEELQQEATNIIIANPNDYLGEQGLKKIIRQRESGSVEKSFLIDKIHHESTLVECEQHREENGHEYDNIQDFREDLGVNDFQNIFGDDNEIENLGRVSSLYYDQNGEITKGFRFGADDFENYGVLEMIHTTPNKIIRVIVGKYFEYDENGNKVFDEHCALYSENYIDSAGDAYTDVMEITEERQEITLKFSTSGFFYIDGDGSDLGFGNTRFILYGFECGEEAYDEYKAREIGGKGVPTLPMFKQSQTFGEVVQFYNEHKDEYGENNRMSFGIYGDSDNYGCTIICDLYIDDDYFYFSGNDNYSRYYCEYNVDEMANSKLYTLLNDCETYEYATLNHLDNKEDKINVDGIYWEQDDFDGHPLPNSDKYNLINAEKAQYLEAIKGLIKRGYVVYNHLVLKLNFVRYFSSPITTIEANFGHIDNGGGYKIHIFLDNSAYYFQYDEM